MTHARMNHVKDHFENEAGIFDERVVRIVPHYAEMLGALVTAIPYSPGKAVRVADLGCGTGTVSFLVKKAFPRARITCVDMSGNMLEQARQKLRGLKDVRFEQGDLVSYDFKGRFDAVVSSLALHHVEARDKPAIYRKINRALAKGGVFANADIILSADRLLQEKYLAKWGEFVLKSFPRREIEKNHRRYLREDRPAVLFDELGILSKAGFRNTDVLWKYYNFAVYRGMKQAG